MFKDEEIKELIRKEEIKKRKRHVDFHSNIIEY
jgi:hypothetical protein